MSSTLTLERPKRTQIGQTLGWNDKLPTKIISYVGFHFQRPLRVQKNFQKRKDSRYPQNQLYARILSFNIRHIITFCIHYEIDYFMSTLVIKIPDRSLSRVKVCGSNCAVQRKGYSFLEVIFLSFVIYFVSTLQFSLVAFKCV